MLGYLCGLVDILVWLSPHTTMEWARLRLDHSWSRGGLEWHWCPVKLCSAGEGHSLTARPVHSNTEAYLTAPGLLPDGTAILFLSLSSPKMLLVHCFSVISNMCMFIYSTKVYWGSLTCWGMIGVKADMESWKLDTQWVEERGKQEFTFI